ncbi:50S ribosomal protein L18 [Rufibacter glacialis]|uniref:Large ribosomal subunit protein uL18 n=1 Tax=Rufibacter glacialis TaxID=1259555 RepID=A0A5M8QS36_9BACT|nr:50S ribosomal protein L18 [Rufibacter glacialis]KAA6437313.1 50S ribosomal protein L18 [Rufibacter glacialis]GGK60265.1 50S ribosomal protein L18 [Rufibacter glacialis]
MAFDKAKRRLRIRRSIRNKVSGTAQRPRLSVFRSNKSIYAQLIDDVNGITLASSSSSTIEGESTTNKSAASTSVGRDIAAKALAKGITEVVFDRGGYLYHGRVKSLADGAREAGLKF